MEEFVGVALRTVVIEPESLLSYWYERLSSPRTIRLLSITCHRIRERAYVAEHRLFEFALDACRKFWAISYAWGDPEPNQSISVDGRRMSISVALRHALHDIFWFIADDDQSTVLIWTDGLCINQSDNDEKSAQVALMGDIY